jgi:ArsR family transcriptional regulator
MFIYLFDMKKTVKTFKALSDPTRLRIILLLMKEELCVCELHFVLNMEQSRISHHLRILRDADLVEDVRDGKWIIYRIPEAMKKKMGPLLYQFLGDETGQSKELGRDIKNLEICLQKQIRESQDTTKDR